MIDYEFYETPEAFTRWLFREVRIQGRVFEPCVGDGAIIRAAEPPEMKTGRQWLTNDLDPRWGALADGRWSYGHPSMSVYHSVEDAATNAQIWTENPIDWTVSNPPFTPAIEIITRALEASRIGVAMHLRASIHEVLKAGVRRTWMATHPPTGILWLPRVAYQRSRSTNRWSTDSVCACWCVWLKDPRAPQFIRYAPEWVIDDLKREGSAYRRRMDALTAARRIV